MREREREGGRETERTSKLYATDRPTDKQAIIYVEQVPRTVTCHPELEVLRL